MANEFFGLRLFAEIRETDQVGKENRDWSSNSFDCVVVRAWIFQDLFHQVLRDVTFQRAPGAQSFQSLQGKVVTKREEPAQAECGQHGNGEEEKITRVVKPDHSGEVTCA